MPCISAVNQTADKAYYYFDGYAHFAAGLACGLAALAAGMAIGIVGDAGVRANAQQPKLFVGMILILIFAEALGLYGLIGAWPLPFFKYNAVCCAVTSAARVLTPALPGVLAVGIILASKAGTATPM